MIHDVTDREVWIQSDRGNDRVFKWEDHGLREGGNSMRSLKKKIVGRVNPVFGRVWRNLRTQSKGLLIYVADRDWIKISMNQQDRGAVSVFMDQNPVKIVMKRTWTQENT
jgi:hypothetical protein